MKNTKNEKINTRSNAGFSLVELIIVIGIMAILSAAIAPSLIRYVKKARLSRFYSDAQSVLSDAQADFTSQLSAANVNPDKITTGTITLGQISNITCDMVYVNDTDSLSNISGVSLADKHAMFYVEISSGTVVACVLNNGTYTGYWHSPDPTNAWTARKN